MKVFAKFDEIPSMILQDIKETKRYGHTVGRSDGLSDNVKTVYPPTNLVCGGYKHKLTSISSVVAASAACIRNAVALREACYLTVSSGVPDALELPGLLMKDNP